MDLTLQLGHSLVKTGNAVNSIFAVPFLAQALQIVGTIITLVEAAEHNKGTCRSLQKRVTIANDTLRQMGEQDLEENPALKEYVACLEAIKAFIARVSGISKFRSWVSTAEVKDEFTSLTARLDVVMKDLGLNTLVRTQKQVTEDRATLDRDLEVIKEFMGSVNNGLSAVDDRLTELIQTVQAGKVSDNAIEASRISASELTEYEGEKGEERISGKIERKTWRFQDVADKCLGPMHGIHLEDVTKEVALLRMLEGCQYVVKFYGTTLIHGSLHLIMEYCELGGLDEYLVKHRETLGWGDRLEMAVGVARGMCFLHEVGILHHDVRAANVLLTAQRQPKITNFHTSRTEADVSRAMADQMRMARWTAPEKMANPMVPFTKRCDVYSFGMLLWEVGTSTIPFVELDAVKAYGRIRKGEREVPPNDMPVGFKESMERAWGHEQKKRPTMSDLFLMLRRAKEAYVEVVATAPAIMAQEDDEDDLEFELVLSDDEDAPLEPLEVGLQAHKEGRYADAWPIFEAHADRTDHPVALFWAGYYLSRGMGGQTKDTRVAMGLWRRAAEDGHVDAMVRYGAGLMQGDGVPKDVVGGFAMLRRAADAGSAVAQYNVGDLLRSGRSKGIPKDETAGDAYLVSSARQGHAHAKTKCDKWSIPY